MQMVMDPTRIANAETRRRRGLFLIALSCLIGLGICLGLFGSASAATGHVASGSAAPTSRAVGSHSHAASSGLGYWLVASDGGIFTEGGAPFLGSTGGATLNKPIVGSAATSDGQGYWLVASDGGIFSYGDAAFFGSAGSVPLNKPIVGMAATPDGNGYWLVASDGGIFNYGAAGFSGSTGGITLNRPIVGMAASFDGKGYYLVASDCGIFNYGDATFFGSTGGMTLNKPIVSMAFSGISGAASKLTFSTQPTGAGGGTAFSTQPTVTIQDAAGDPVTTDTSNVTLALEPGTPSTGGPGTLSACTSTGGLQGVYSFSGCAIDKAGSGYKLVATDGALAGAISAPFTVGTGPAKHVAFTTEPSNAIGGSAFVMQPVVAIEDAGGNTVTSDTHPITLTKASGLGTLSGCTATTTAGVAHFSGCAINTAGTYTLSAADVADTLSSTSTPFDVGTGLASQLAFTTQPAGATGGTAFGTQPTVTIEDAGGNAVTTDTNAIVMTLTTGPGALAGCTATTTAGVAAFSGCRIDTAATGDVLTATDAGDTLNHLSNAFDVTVGAPVQLVFTTQAGNAAANTPFGVQPVLTIEDAGGNTVVTDTNDVTLAIASGTGTLSGCVSTTSAGVASFSGCTIDTPGSFMLSANEAPETLNGQGTAFDVTP